MRRLSRRALVGAALAHGAVPAFARVSARQGVAWRETPGRFPQGVASGDPGPDSLLIWTRRPSDGDARVRLLAEVAEDEGFGRVVARRSVTVGPQADWTCRVMVGGLRPSRTYWYRFTDADGNGSRIGRTRTAPSPDDPRPVRFAFVSCQNVNLGPLTAWRRMMFDDRAAGDEGVEFVLHLGDFVYETVWRSADHPHGYFDRHVRDFVVYPDGETQGDVIVPASLEDYRTLYRAYLEDPDLQAARARWPFVAIWDNGEFSDKGWQGLQRVGDVTRPAQTRKAAANQAWWEFMPSRAVTRDGSLARFPGPKVTDAPVTRFDADGLGLERNNLAAIGSLRGYRMHRWGRHVELILTDQRSYRSEDFTAAPEARAMASARFPQMVPFESLQAIDAGTAADTPRTRLRFADQETDNFRKDSPPRTLLGAEQKAWFLDRLSRATATWKVWANTVATLDMRADPQHLPPGLTEPWPGEGYAGYARTDFSTAFRERGEIYDQVARCGIAGFVTLSGDRHSFWAGLSAKALPPESFSPVGVSFVVGSISSPGMVEAFEHTLPKAHPLHALYLVDRPGRAKPEPTVNLLLKHGVRSCLDYAAHDDLVRARALSDPGLAPHVEFVDMGGHGYAVVTADAQRFAVEFVCIPRPVEDPGTPDGGPLRYRVAHAADLWSAGEVPHLRRTALEGDAGLSA